jgi:twinkle protein
MKTFSDFNIDIPPGASGQIRTLCPECSGERKKQNNKCLSVDISKGVFFCHHCGHSGGLNGDKDNETLQKFIKPKYSPKTKLPDKVVEWFKGRGISEKVLALNKIGYGQSWQDKNGIQFPYYKDGVVVNIKHRSAKKDFRQEKNAEKCLYRFDEISECRGNDLIITEGEIDALSLQTVGYEMVTSIPDGAPSTDAKQFNSKFDFLKSAEAIFRHCTKIILAVDNDTPGKLVEQELARRIGAERCYRVHYPDGCKDANDVLVKHGGEALREAINKAAPLPVEGLFSAADFEDEVCLLYRLGENRGESTGWNSLDGYYTVKPGEFTVITGIPGAGKSNFLDALVVNMAQDFGWRFVFFSPENWPVKRHLQSLIEKTEKKPFAKHGQFEERMSETDVREVLGVLSEYFYFIYPERDMLTVDTILEKARAAIFRYGVRGVIIDPWNEVDHQYENMTEAQYLSKSLSKIRQFAKRNAVHVWVVAHPRNLVKDKDGNYKPPTMYEISGGAHWRNKADNGLCLFRNDYQVHETEIFIQKIRFKEVGKVGSIKLKYIEDTGDYAEISEAYNR